MSTIQSSKPLSEDTLNTIISRYDQEQLRISSAYPDGGIDPLWPRFSRAVINQLDAGDATFSRYAIWANTVRDNIIEALNHMEIEDEAEVKRLLVRAANSLSAFAEVQAHMDWSGVRNMESG